VFKNTPKKTKRGAVEIERLREKKKKTFFFSRSRLKHEREIA